MTFKLVFFIDSNIDFVHFMKFGDTLCKNFHIYIMKHDILHYILNCAAFVSLWFKTTLHCNDIVKKYNLVMSKLQHIKFCCHLTVIYLYVTIFIVYLGKMLNLYNVLITEYQLSNCIFIY